jgi:hypothetical protein
MRYIRLSIITVLIAILIQGYSSTGSSDTVIVCISKTSYKYHARSCKGVKACTHEIKKVSIAEAREMGKTPCGFCY